MQWSMTFSTRVKTLEAHQEAEMSLADYLSL
jgi:hypothetical protein